VRTQGIRSVFYQTSENGSNMGAAASTARTMAKKNSVWLCRRTFKLWVALEILFLAMLLALATFVSALWFRNNRFAVKKVTDTAKYILADFEMTAKRSVNSVVQRSHTQRANSAFRYVEAVMENPYQLVQLNSNMLLDRLSLAQASSGGFVSSYMRTLWEELKTRMWRTDFAYYADSTGIFVGYRRMPGRHGPMSDNGEFPNETYWLDFRPPNNRADIQLACPDLCPSPGEIPPGGRGTWKVNRVTGLPYGSPVATSQYDASLSDWYRQALRRPGNVVWAGPYRFASMETWGVTAAIAVEAPVSSAEVKTGKTYRVLGADLAFKLFSDHLSTMTGDGQWERMFIVQGNGVLVASSVGTKGVKLSFKTTENQRLWYESKDVMVMQPIRALLDDYGSWDKVPRQGTQLDDSHEYMFAWVRWSSDSIDSPVLESAKIFESWIIFSVQDLAHTMKNVTEREAQLKAWADNTIGDLQQQLTQSAFATLTVCAGFTFLGAIGMAFVAHRIAQPLRLISRDMRSLAKLEFIESRDRPSDAPDRCMVCTPYSGAEDPDGFSTDDSSPSKDSASSAGSSSDACSRGGLGQLAFDGRKALWRGVRGCWRGDDAIQPSQIREVAEMREAFNYMSNGLRSFSRYMDPNVVKMLVDSNQQARLGMAKGELTIFFSDIANFTTIAEEMEPEDFMNLLHEYLGEMSDCIMEYQGVVGEFIGDAIMAWWNAPVELGPVHTCLALRSAMAQQQLLRKLRVHWRRRGRPEVRVRMGLVCGDVLAGNIGSHSRMKFGLVGDSVNLASRLEGLCKFYGVSVLIEERARNAPQVDETFFCRLVDIVTVKGRSSPTELFELVGLKECLAHSNEYSRFVEEFGAIHALYRRRAFTQAVEALESYQQGWPDDVPARLLRSRCEALLANPPGDDWSYVVNMLDK